MKNIILTVFCLQFSFWVYSQEESAKKTYRDYSKINIENRINNDALKIYYVPKKSFKNEK